MVTRWEDIAGHDKVTAMLCNMLASGRMPHALLFEGPAGIGKLLAARTLAAAILCGGRDKPCGECPSCRLVGQGTHPDLVELAADGASLKIDQIRALQHEAALAPYFGSGRVFLVEEAERLTVQAANSLLKILEEPPAGSVFILTASSRHAMLPTVVSRCRVFPFRPLAPEALARLLAARGADGARAAMAARLSGGRVGEALALLAEGGLALRDAALTVVAALPAGGASLVWAQGAALDKLAAPELAAFLRHLRQVLRDLLVVVSGREELALNSDVAGELRRAAAAWDARRLDEALRVVRDAGRALEGNANTRLTLEAMLIHLLEAAREGTRDADRRRYSV
ncbi:DNA polymerase III subunit delta' [Anaeroselena agilis]|uniref:DNA polymerase III subunit delta n=1 Tax=Anaeroselena agilis TaxID=3063788 RepID=A0ABU3P3S6_9FIRM|nr:DNA polymerase III subunit delta' [Selenomonadales bacterium 4137-cl]